MITVWKWRLHAVSFMLKTTLLRKRKHQEPVFVVYFLTLFFTTVPFQISTVLSQENPRVRIIKETD